MWHRFLFLFGCFLFPPIFTFAGERSPNQDAEFQGTWQVLDLEGNGEKKPADEAQGLKIIFEGDQIWLVKPTGADPKLKFKLNPEKKTIDLTVQEGKDAGKVALGIYSFANGQLRLCVNIFGDPSFRPSEFKTQQGDGAVFVALKRAKVK